MNKEKLKICEALNYGKTCNNQARFQIMHFECGNLDKDYVKFWICEKCIKFFIGRS
jgi:hypothetical protein